MTSIQSLLNEERRHTTPIEFYGTHQAAVDLMDYNNYVHGQKISDVEDDFVKSKRIIRLSKLVKFQSIAADRLRILVRPIEQTAFNRLLSGLDTIPSVAEQPAMNHYMYADISMTALLRTKHEKEEAISRLDLGSALSTLTPLKLSGYDHFYSVAPKSSQQGEPDEELKTA